MTSNLRMGRYFCFVLAGAASTLSTVAPRSADAEESCLSEPPPARPERPRTPLAAAAAVLPGLVVHGSGHFVLGDRATASKLLILETIGLGMLAAGIVPIVLSGASRRVVGPAAALTMVGGGIFVISALADIYGVLAPAGGTGAPSRVTPLWQTELGVRHVDNPVFGNREFVVYGVDYRPGPWRIYPSAWFASDQSTSRVRVPVGYRLAGPTSEETAAFDGSFLELETAMTRLADLPDRFVILTAEISLNGRLDLGRIAPSLTGSFAEMGLGWAAQNYRYQVKGASGDVGDLLLGRFGYGIYVGRPGRSRGEIMAYYDHRHDDFAAGLKLPGLGSGVAGHFGLEGHAYLTDHWGFKAEVMAGSAYVAGASLTFRQGDPL